MLANELRPQKLEDVIGNQHIKDTLSTYFSTGKIPHTLMLDGKFGSGKTTIARIIANQLGVSNPIEVDCAANGDIAKIRELVEGSNYNSIFSENTVIVLDEVHKLSQPAQNALLKTTEDTPEGTYFILCTSEPKSIIPALKSRCVTLTVNPATIQEIREAYKKARDIRGNLELEGGKRAWDLVVEKSNGSLRQAYMLFDSMYAAVEQSPDKVLTLEQLEGLLGMSAEEEFTETSPLPQAFMRKDIVKALGAIETAKKEGRQPMSTLIGLYNYLKKARTKEDKALLADIAFTLAKPDEANTWYALEGLAFKHL